MAFCEYIIKLKTVFNKYLESIDRFKDKKTEKLITYNN